MGTLVNFSVLKNFCGFPQSLQATSGIVSKISYGHSF
jgi:hypothetical protein